MHETPTDSVHPWLVVVNPMAANGQVQRQWPRWEARLRSLLPNLLIIDTRPTGGLMQAITQAQATGLAGVLAVGGDGTAHLVVNAIQQVQVASGQSILFALLPLGTGNDWIKTHRIPRYWPAWRRMFERQERRRQHLGLLTYQDQEGETTQHYFLNVAGLAYDAFVVEDVSKRQTGGGKLIYLWATLRCLFRYTPQKAHLRWSDGEAEASCYTINVGIGRYSGGGMQLVPHAKPQGDGLALTYVKRLSRLRVLLNSWRFYRGWVRGLPEAELTTVQALHIDSTDTSPILLEADGEFLGQTPVQVELVPNALLFVGN